jgi:hypothetical protein
MSKFKFYIVFDTETQQFEVTNAETGETQVSAIKQKSKKTVIEESSIPELILESNKYTLNKAAVELMNVKPGQRLDIKFDVKGNPVIGTDIAFGTVGAGNLLTKSNTVRFSGINNSRLSEIDTKFTITKQPDTDNINIFNLVSDKKEIIEENIELNEVSNIVEEPDDFDLSDLLDDEIYGLDFNLN